MNGPLGHYAEKNKLDSQKKTNSVQSLFYVKYSNNNKLIDQRTDWWLPEVGVGGGRYGSIGSKSLTK